MRCPSRPFKSGRARPPLVDRGRPSYTSARKRLGKGLYPDRDRLFVPTLCLTIVMTLVFGAALGYDLASNRGGGNQTVSTLAPDQGTSTDNGTTATPTAGPAGAAAAAGANAAKPGSAAAPVVGSAQVGTNVTVASGAPILLGALITQSG